MFDIIIYLPYALEPPYFYKSYTDFVERLIQFGLLVKVRSSYNFQIYFSIGINTCIQEKV